MAKGAAFVTTHWSIVVEAGQTGSPKASEALAELCRVYWYPIYAYVRRRGYSPDDAEDLTQGYFARLVEKNSLACADRDRGRFRTFLLGSLDNFLNNEWDRSHAQKRGGGQKTISWNEEDAEGRYRNEPIETMTPERIFEKRWAVTLLELVLHRMRNEFTANGRVELFEVIKAHLWGEEAALSYADLATQLNMTTVAIKVTVHRLRQRYQALLREEIGRTVATPAQVDDEIRHLIAVMSE